MELSPPFLDSKIGKNTNLGCFSFQELYGSDIICVSGTFLWLSVTARLGPSFVGWPFRYTLLWTTE
jgi:hypothetical protein